jgi:hypothetical protein
MALLAACQHADMCPSQYLLPLTMCLALCASPCQWCWLPGAARCPDLAPVRPLITRLFALHQLAAAAAVC